MSKYSWKDIQKFYNKGKMLVDVRERFGVSFAAIYKAKERGDFIFRSASESQKISHKKNPRTHSDETKKKISKIRRDYLEKNPDKVPYLLNHYSKGMSYPEKYFEKVFREEGIDLEYHYRIGLYELDFADPIRKIDIEIDGSQHYFDEKIIKSDLRRDKFMRDKGWTVYRVNWSNYCKLQKSTKKMIVQQIKDIISGVQLSTEDMLKIKKELSDLLKPNLCIDCSTEIHKKSKRCPMCSVKEVGARKRVDRPSKVKLKEMIDTMSWVAIGKRYGVSDNAVKKWARNYGIEFKIRKYNKTQNN